MGNIEFRGSEFREKEVVLVKEFEKILEHQFLLVEEITWKKLELHNLISRAESYFYDKKDKRDEVDFVWQLAVSNDSVVGIGLYLNGITSLPEFISEFKSLEYLVLNVGDLEIIPESIGELESLRVLNLRENQLRTLPNSIGKLKSLEILDLGRNQLDELPDSIGNLNSLNSLWLDNNQFKTLPESFKNLDSLNDLHLTYNSFKTLPNPIKYLKALKELSATHLTLTELPSWIGDIESLESLFLSDNDLTHIPDSIGKLKQLKSLLLNDNNLTSLPESIIDLNSLKLLNLNGNEIKNFSKFFVPLKRRGVTVATTADEVSIDWDLNNRIQINKILEKGNNLILTGNYSEAMKNLEIATELAEKLSNFNDMIHYKSAILNFTGRIYLLQGNFNKSLENAMEMLKYTEQKNDLPGKAVVYNNIGNAYNGMGKNKEAVKYYKMGLKLLKAQGLENSPNALTIKNSISALKKKK